MYIIVEIVLFQQKKLTAKNDSANDTAAGSAAVSAE